jgi:hypothetical protein
MMLRRSFTAIFAALLHMLSSSLNYLAVEERTAGGTDREYPMPGSPFCLG